MKFIPYDETAEVLQPGKQPLNFPSATVTPQGTAVLRFDSFFPVWGDHFNAPILFQLGVELVTVVGLVADQALRQFVGKGLVRSVFHQSHFMRHRACRVKGERKTGSVAVRVRDNAGLPKDFRPLHGLRHTFASWMASTGAVDLYTLQKLLTHGSAQMTQRYAHLADEALQRAAAVAGDVFQDVSGEKAEVDTLRQKETSVGKYLAPMVYNSIKYP